MSELMNPINYRSVCIMEETREHRKKKDANPSARNGCEIQEAAIVQP